MKRIYLFLLIMLLGVQTVSATRLDPEGYGGICPIITSDKNGNVIKTDYVKYDSSGNVIWKNGEEVTVFRSHPTKYTSFKMNGKTYTMVEKFGEMPEVREGHF